MLQLNNIMTQFLSKWAIPRVILPFFILNLIFSFLFTRYENQLSTIAGEKVQILDKYPLYTKVQVMDLFTKIKAEGRETHQFVTGVVDMVYPLIYGPFLMLLITFFLKKIFGPKVGGINLVFGICLCLMITDYCENFTTLQLLSSFPNLEDSVVSRGSTLANLKLVLLLLCSGLVLFSALGWIGSYLMTSILNRKR